MTVIYRITSIPSTNPSPIYQEDKDKLNRLCLKSFLRAFSDVEMKVIFIADYCSERMVENLEDYPWEHEVIETGVGQNETMLMAYDIASKLDDYVLFHESDYFYRGVIGKEFELASRILNFLSPYDHPNFYKDRTLHSPTCEVKLIGSTHYRTTERNTMTWGCPSILIKNHKDVFDKYGYLDGQVWYDLEALGYNLWVPIPSFATHMVENCIAPGMEGSWLNTQ